MQSLNVALGDRSYPIHIGRGLLHQSALLSEAVTTRRAAVVTNQTVAPLYLTAVSTSLREAGIEPTEIVLPDGEGFKNWETLNRIFDALLAHRCDRRTPVIALGGGVIGDMAGFAAATYQRGVPFIQVPTTLLSQVDSSVGGKTAINHPLGKNMIGAFWQPRLVLADTDTLDTLPLRELRAGLAEVIKYGLIRDPAFFAWIESHLEALLARVPDALAYAIHRSCANKAEVVAADETEQGERALLNLGHTFGHAIETGLGYGEWLHGEAVAAGMVIAAELSARLGWLQEGAVERIRQLLLRVGLPVLAPRLGVARYLDLMAHDKKMADGRMHLILLKSIGHGVIHAESDAALIGGAIDACCA
jgi:3-dehydroquinate synthase